MFTTIIQIVASIFGVAASLWISKILNKYLQRIEDVKQERETEKQLTELQKEAIRRQKELDRLKEIENQRS